MTGVIREGWAVGYVSRARPSLLNVGSSFYYPPELYVTDSQAIDEQGNGYVAGTYAVRYVREVLTTYGDRAYEILENHLAPPSVEMPPSECAGCQEEFPYGYRCEDCVECARCREWVNENDTGRTARGNTVCESCLTQHYWQCGSCDCWNRDRYSECYNECSQNSCDDGGCDCEDCSGDQSSGYVFEYSYKPYPDFHGDDTKLYLGLELETETRSGTYEECARVAFEHLGSIGYLKRDSSLNSGFEMVTHPMTYKYAMESFPWDLLKDLEGRGAYTEESHTGLHVHLSRDGFSGACHIHRWMKFIYRNQEQVVTLARRDSDEWASFNSHNRSQVKHYAKGSRGGGRYQAINPTNDATFELRMFASSLKPEEVKAALGFAAASVEYTRQLTVASIAKEGGWTWGAFTQWLTENPTYQPLAQQLEDLQCVS